MKRQFAIFALASLVIGAGMLFSVLNVLADLSALLPEKPDLTQLAFTLQPAESGAALSADEWAAARQIIDNRLEQMELPAPHSVMVRPGEQQIRVTVPQNANMPGILNLITHAGNVRFVDGGINPPKNGATLVGASVLFAYSDIIDTALPNPDYGELFYQFRLNDPAAARVQQFSAQSGNAVCLLLDETVAGCTQMVYSHDNAVEILPEFGDEGLGLDDLKILMVSGPLPGALTVAN